MFPGLFEGYFMTSDIGFRKNRPEFYHAVVVELQKIYLDTRPRDICFFDDSQSKVDTARLVGIDAHLYENVAQVEAVVNSAYN